MSLLKRVTIERSTEGRFAVLREHETGGERFVCDDLLEVYETISAAYRPDGTPRSLDSVVDIEIVPAPGDACGNSKRLGDGSTCPGCRACD